MRFRLCWARCRSSRVEQRDDVIDLVQHLLEPELVDLVNDDEEHFVMFGAFGPRPLQGK